MKRLIFPAIIVGALAPAAINKALADGPRSNANLVAAGLADRPIARPERNCFFIFPRWRVRCANSTSSRNERDEEGRDGGRNPRRSVVPAVVPVVADDHTPAGDESVIGTPDIARSKGAEIEDVFGTRDLGALDPDQRGQIDDVFDDLAAEYLAENPDADRREVVGHVINNANWAGRLK